ncbi:GNAT family N-acetyltransferase [Pseudosporangium ferrugineum]|uniref:Acetyltransferase (GNAT) family protein n=1 Tax=Pseudosporangium ferrugineum TaxID=439699 RepID=A0A2T0SAS5_9ACTN|nr:GNAT family N-acetyltransferase [Pseudosporangium ferrugineum]PRY30520.1 acetyltransferase (GNAT) family protein [Pseudosporangium ferrugineum]
MTSTTPTLRIGVGRADALVAADIVADAFDPLGVIRFLVPDPARRRPVSRAWYELHVQHAIDGAGRVVLTADDSAVAVWFDRTGESSEPGNYAKRLAALVGADLPQFEHLDRQMENNHPHDPHWHLLFLAVRRGRQRQGLGSMLLHHTHEWLDAQGHAAYLEATDENNEKLYATHGYQPMTPPGIRIADGVPPLRRMWRPARNG